MKYEMRVDNSVASERLNGRLSRLSIIRIGMVTTIRS